MSPKTPKPMQGRTRRPRVTDFREAIALAEQEGVAKEDMVLRLTLQDTAELKRDRTVALEDIAFRDGEMRFLGVKVTPGGVTVSTLDRSPASPA